MGRLSQIRQANTMTQAAVAQLAGVSVSTIQNIEARRKVPSVVLAMKLANIFDTTVEDLFSDYITEKEGVGSKNE